MWTSVWEFHFNLFLQFFTPYLFTWSNTVGIWILTIWKPETFEYHTFWNSDFNGLSMGYVLYTRPAIQIPNHDGVHFCGIQMVGLCGIQMAFENQIIWHPTSFRPLKYQTSLVFRSPLFVCKLLASFQKLVHLQIFPDRWMRWHPQLDFQANSTLFSSNAFNRCQNRFEH